MYKLEGHIFLQITFQFRLISTYVYFSRSDNTIPVNGVSLSNTDVKEIEDNHEYVVSYFFFIVLIFLTNTIIKKQDGNNSNHKWNGDKMRIIVLSELN